MGVQVNGADFVVDNKYNVSAIFGNNTQTAPSTFNNLWYGVNIYQYADANRSIVMNSNFTNTDHAIYASSAFKPIFTGNTMAIPQNNGYQEQQYTFGTGLYKLSEGIHMADCSNYTVQNNRMTANTNYSGTKTIGIYVYSSGPQANKINSNSISNANFNFYANGQNYDNASFLTTIIGLKFICNINAGAKGNDFTVMGGYNNGIAGVQNSGGLITAQSAANTFAAKGPGGYYSFFMENGCNTVKYYGYGTSKNLNNYPHTSNVSPYNIFDYSCPVYIMGPKFPLATQWENRLNSLESGIATISNLPAPDSMQTDTLQNYYDSYAELRDSVLNHYLYDDTSSIHYDSLAYALEHMNLGYDYKVWLAGVYQSMLRYDDAIELLGNINGQFELDETAIQRIDNIKVIYGVLKTLNDNGYDVSALSEDDLFAVQQIYYEDDYIAHGIAAGLLNRFQDIITYNPVPDTGEGNESTIALNRNMNIGTDKELLLYPVPAQNLLTVQWTPVTAEPGTIFSIADLTGRTLISVSIVPGTQSIMLPHLSPGIYLATVKTANGHIVAKQKLVKQ